MKPRYLFAALLLILELPILLPLAAGAVITGALYLVTATYAHSRRLGAHLVGVVRAAGGRRLARPALGS